MNERALPRKQLFERLLSSHARDTGTTAARIRRWVTTMVLIGALDRVRSVDDSHRFVIKGGVALELRLGLRARATQDVDMTFHGQPNELLESLRLAFSTAYSGFEFQAGEPVPIGATGAHRVEVRVRYLTKNWATTRVEIAVTPALPVDVDLVPAIGLEDFRLNGPDNVATLSLPYQIAQKIHAVTERFPTGENTRVRDIVDLLLLEDLVDDLATVRDACVEVFGERATHEWPPVITTYDSWSTMFERIAAELDFPIATLSAAVDATNALIARIDTAG